ncbi:hypothetical protein R20233_04850 [Ralstonia sp. LMG 32965]|uniref:hypothetical protein n=1 Tax=Ralstonia flatus TaxID=3058601 RepID=UPI0028F62855|nr:hypothetical protein [Ralstonia sp. LMG 32965]CAJ0902886.1 hypothetical protein R20233_04850 [Ralstonia sp. LMG 32965]
MTIPDRELRLMETFVGLLSDHQKDFEGFVRDIENVRYCHAPIDTQQINRCEYALRNMEIRLLTIHNCIHAGRFDADTLDKLVQTKNAWVGMKNRVDGYLGEIHHIIGQTSAALRPVRDALAV